MARGPAYPYFDLQKAVGIITEVFDYTKKNPTTPAAIIKDVLKLSTTSSSAKKTLAALRYYGLIEDVDGGSNKQVKLSRRALDILFAEKSSAAYSNALRQAALEPVNYKYCWDAWGKDLPSDAAMKSHLILERGFIDTTVSGFIKDYKSTLKFAGFGSTPPPSADETPNNDDKTPPTVKIGDMIQWESDSQWQFDQPREVVKLSPENDFVFVPGSDTGIPISEVTVVEQGRDKNPGGQSETSRRNQYRTPEKPMGTIRSTMEFENGIEAVLLRPDKMTREDFEDFQAWIEIMVRRAKRTIVKPEDLENGKTTED